MYPYCAYITSLLIKKQGIEMYDINWNKNTDFNAHTIRWIFRDEMYVNWNGGPLFEQNVIYERK